MNIENWFLVLLYGGGIILFFVTAIAIVVLGAMFLDWYAEEDTNYLDSVWEDMKW